MPTASRTKTTEKSRKTATKTSTRKTSSASKKSKSTGKSTRKRAVPSASGIEAGKPDIEVPTLPIDLDSERDISIDEISSNISKLKPDPATREIRTHTSIPPAGEFDISRKVLARIASLAAAEISGLEPPRRDPINRLMDSIQGRTDGIKVDIGSTEAAVDMLVRVRYGSRIPEITTQLREKVARRIYEMTGLNVVEINVRVQDITPRPPSGKSA